MEVHLILIQQEVEFLYHRLHLSTSIDSLLVTINP